MAFSETIAQILMTLSAMAYGADHAPRIGEKAPDLSETKKTLIQDLNNTDYITDGKWGLAWGPIEHLATRNLVYVAQRKNTDTYAIVQRGTVPNIHSYSEDIPDGQVALGYGAPNNATVSTKFMEGFQGAIGQIDTTSNQTLGQFLASTAKASGPMTIYVTGHSQGGGLTPITISWLNERIKSYPRPDQHQTFAYAFAPPTAGNPAFAQWINDKTHTHLVINPLDVVPMGYAQMEQVITNNIPTKVPWLYAKIIREANKLATKVGPWKHASDQFILPKVQLGDDYGYLKQLAGQHNHNSYLLLLGAPQIDDGKPSILPPLTTQ